MSDVRDMPDDKQTPEVPRDPAQFERTLEAIQHRTVTLMCAITAASYLAAWLEKRELEYAIQRAERIARALSAPSGRDDVTRRLAELIAVSDRILALAPAPSPSAIRQARSPDRQADRSDWEREEQQWIAARAATAPLCPPGIPDRSRVLHAVPRTVEIDAGDAPVASDARLRHADTSGDAD